jgi:hypothetical protein
VVGLHGGGGADRGATSRDSATDGSTRIATDRVGDGAAPASPGFERFEREDDGTFEAGPGVDTGDGGLEITDSRTPEN